MSPTERWDVLWSWFVTICLQMLLLPLPGYPRMKMKEGPLPTASCSVSMVASLAAAMDVCAGECILSRCNHLCSFIMYYTLMPFNVLKCCTSSYPSRCSSWVLLSLSINLWKSRRAVFSIKNCLYQTHLILINHAFPPCARHHTVRDPYPPRYTKYILFLYISSTNNMPQYMK